MNPTRPAPLQNASRKLAVLAGLLALAGIALPAAAPSGREVPVYRAQPLSGAAPVIDGRLDDDVWRQAKRAPIQRQHHDEKPLPEGQRNAGYWMAAWDAENLYLAVSVIDQNVNAREARPYEPHNDVVELFFDPLLNYQFNLQYRVWPFGRRGDGGEITQDPTWGRWEVASTQTDTGYCTEVRVPLSHFMEVAQVDLRPGDLMGFDVSVHDVDFPDDTEWVSPKITGWSGDGTNWQYASQNGILTLGEPRPGALASARPQVDDVGETPDHEAMALWPSLRLVDGFFNLDVPNQSWSWESYQPWRLGRVRHELVGTAAPGDARAVNRTVGPHAHGEALEPRPRVVELALSGVRDGRHEELTIITTPFHPAICYRTNSGALTLFDDMVRVGQPTGPSYVALPLESGVSIRKIDTDTAAVFDAARDGALAEGWVLVWFAREGDPRATDFPMVVYPNRSPREITLADAGGLTWHFDLPGRGTLTLMPLQGIAAVEKSTTQAWAKAGALPSGATDRVRTWQKRSLRLPVGVTESWQYHPERRVFELRHRFAYSENLSQWPVEEELIAPLPQLLSSTEAIARFPATPLVDLDYRLFQGNYYGVTGRAEIRFELPEVDLSLLPPRLDRAKLMQSETGRNYLAQLDELNLARIFAGNMDRVMKRPYFMPHIWPMIDKPDLFSGYPLIPEDERTALIRRVEEGYEKIIFSDEWRERLWPETAPYLGSNFRYGNLTYPYGVAEPYYGVVEMLSKMYYFCQGNNDYSVIVRYWPRLKELTEIIWHGGFVQYRYDGGTMIGEALVGLVKGAEAAGDRRFQRRAMLRLAQHAASAPGYLEGGQRLAADKSWTWRGRSPVLFGPIQQTTPNTAAPIADGSLTGSDGTFYWDRGYGNPVVLREFALPQVRAIEAQLDRDVKNWSAETGHNFKRRDGMFRRFTVRALVIREPMDKLEAEAASLRTTFVGNPEFDAAILIILMQRIQEDSNQCHLAYVNI
ncbi:hypothetical protein OH491_01815 [Termitidicoccus mucosus]|uniref:Carbohydrate-binding domain-containing protein n=1 Tax=Termitidicoccus mucosus TaxID=1184151 RepID=A0A178IL23_9BACT|nr:hypothetical protein AW736_07740 [Opitutaceae bacterium TSB47]